MKKYNFISFKTLTLIYVLYIPFLTCSCDNKEVNVESSQIIERAAIFSFSELDVYLQEQITKYDGPMYADVINGQWDWISYDENKSYYIKCDIRNDLLAQICESPSMKMEFMMDENPLMLYGKHTNKFICFDSTGRPGIEGEIKNRGYNILTIERNSNIDKIIIGPIPFKPTKLQVKPLADGCYFDGKLPEYSFR